MKKSIQTSTLALPLVLTLSIVAILLLGLLVYQWMGVNRAARLAVTQTAKQKMSKENCLADGCLLVEDADFPVATLDEKTTEFLNMALADERKALATYQATMTKFGSVKPFVNIARSEEQHISMLLSLFDKYGVAIPNDATKVGALPATLQEVCAVGVTAEIDNDALYQKMLPEVTQEDIKTVFTSLAAASKERHLPAFERCAN